MSGLTDSGFERKTLAEILDSIKQKALNEFGPDFNTQDDSVFMQLAGVFSLELDEIWQGLEGAHSAYTLSGAEGVYLDDLFARHNIIRLDAVAGTGVSYIESDETTVLPQTIDPGLSVTTSSGIPYSLATGSNTLVDIDKTWAYKILSEDIVAGNTYTIFCENDLGVVVDTTIAVLTEAAKGAFISSLKAFIDATNTTLASETFDFVAEEEIYLGYTANKQLNPLANSLTFYTSPAIGNRYTKVDLVADVAGYNPLPSGGVLDATPKFTGFVSISNVAAFVSGSNVETDPEFRARFNRIIDASAVGCDRQSIETAILSLTGVIDARIYENPTSTPTAEAAAYSYNTVVMGGTSSEIAQKLFDVGPINVSTDGTLNTPLTTTSGDTINIKFTPATASDLSIRITYSTLDNTDLTDTEQATIKAALAELSLNFAIGTTVFSIQLSSAVVSSLNYGRLTSLTVENKLVSEPVGSFTTNDYTPLFTEFPSIDQTEITFVRV